MKQRERCQKRVCVRARAELADAKDVARKAANDLANERQGRAQYLAGDVRRYQARIAELEADVRGETEWRKDAIDKRNHCRRQASGLRAERRLLLEEIAQLKGDLAMATKQLAQIARREALDERLRNREAGKLRWKECELEKAEHKIEKRAEKAQAEAEAQVEEAEAQLEAA